MMILGVFGSPRRSKLSSQLVARALEGAASAGADVRRLYLVDYDIPSFPRSAKTRHEELDRLVTESDAMVIGSPVYYKDVSGLIREFIDYLHSGKHYDLEGEPAVGICVAGGSGMGQITALRSLYGFFFFRGMRPIDPIPVSRFNFQKVLDVAYSRGERLARMSETRQGFLDLTEKLKHFSSLAYLDYDMVDEIILVGEQLLESSEREASVLESCRKAVREAAQLRDKGKKQEAVEVAVGVYEALFH